MAGGVHVVSLYVADSGGAQSNVISVSYEVSDDPPVLELLSTSYWGQFVNAQPESDQILEFRLKDQDTRQKWTVLRSFDENDWINSGLITPGVHRVRFPASEFPYHGSSMGGFKATIYVVTDLWVESNTLSVTYDRRSSSNSDIVAPIATGVGAFVLVVAVVTVICICVRRRRRAREHGEDSLSNTPTYGLQLQAGDPGPPIVYPPPYLLPPGYEPSRK
jgi:hypothetical protein